MSVKTERLVDLLPDCYAAGDPDSVLHALLDAVGTELMVGDEKVKRLLKSHWVRYAEGSALDALAALYGVTRRTLRSSTLQQPVLESDPAFRVRLQSIVSQFTGGGTVAAVKGAVRSALGLPFNLDQLGLGPPFAALRADIDALVQVREFSPKADRVLASVVAAVDLDGRVTAHETVVDLAATTVTESLPRIEWIFTRGAGRRLSVERQDAGLGFRSVDPLLVGSGSTIVFTADAGGRLSAVIDGVERADQFVNLDGSAPAVLPEVPVAASAWRFRAQSALLDTAATFDDDAFDLPQFRVAFSRVVFEPLTFDVTVPFFLDDAVTALKLRHGFTGELFAFQGIPLEHVQQVVDQTRAAGVRGNVRFSLRFFERHQQRDRLRIEGVTRRAEDAGAREALVVANTNAVDEEHDTRDRMAFGGLFDRSTFDGPWGLR